MKSSPSPGETLMALFQGPLILEQIEKALWIAGPNQFQTAERLIHTGAFEKMVSNFLKNFKLQNLKKTRVIINLEPSGKKLSLRRDLAKILPGIAQGGRYDYCHEPFKRDPSKLQLPFFDKKYEILFANEVLKDDVALNAIVYEVNQGPRNHYLTHLLEEMKAAKTPVPEFHIIHALMLVNQLAKSGLIKKFSGGLFIPLKKRSNSKLKFHLSAYYYPKKSQASCAGKINLSISETNDATGVSPKSIFIL
jgi:hypothetical protein